MAKYTVAAMEALIAQYMGLVCKCALNTRSDYFDLDDRRQIATIAFMGVIESFDSTKGKFTSYAWVAMENAIRSESRKIASDKVRVQMAAREDVVSQYALGGSICSDRLVSICQLKSICDRVLTHVESHVLVHRLGLAGESYTLHELSRQLNMSHESVRRIEVRAVKRIRSIFAA